MLAWAGSTDCIGTPSVCLCQPIAILQRTSLSSRALRVLAHSAKLVSSTSHLCSSLVSSSLPDVLSLRSCRAGGGLGVSAVLRDPGNWHPMEDDLTHSSTSTRRPASARPPTTTTTRLPGISQMLRGDPSSPRECLQYRLCRVISPVGWLWAGERGRSAPPPRWSTPPPSAASRACRTGLVTDNVPISLVLYLSFRVCLLLVGRSASSRS